MAIVLPAIRTVWIASDFSGPFNGTASNPFDGSTVEKFDALMRFPEGTRIRLLDGVFETTGSANFNEAKGWFVKDGWQIIGNGPERTTVKLVSFPVAAISNGHGALQMAYTSNGGTTVAGLTVDENWQDGVVDNNYCTFGVNLYGNDCSIRNVRSLHGFGSRVNNVEAFSLTICSRHNGVAWEDNTNGVIEGCEVRDFLGDYGIGIALVPGADGATGSVEGWVANNVVRNLVGTAAFGVSSHVLFEGNTSEGCSCDYYNDTGRCEGVIICRNQMGPTSGFNVHFNPMLGAAMVRDIVIEDNIIDVRRIGVALSGQLGVGHQFDIVVRGNTFRKVGEGTDVAAIVAGHVTGLLVVNNLVDYRLPSMLNQAQYPSTGVVSSGNQILGAPIGLEPT